MLILHKMPLVLVAVIAAILMLNPFFPYPVQQVFYAISLTIKSLILFLLPIIIFGLLLKTMISLARRATIVILIILLCVCVSNAISTFLSHYVGEWVYHFDFSLVQPRSEHALTPAWSWQLPKLIANDKAMLFGIVLGIMLGVFNSQKVQIIAARFDWLVLKILESFAYLIPPFIAGFVVKMQYDGAIQVIFKDYTVIFAVVALAQIIYILFLYTAFNHFKLRETLRCLENMLPAAIAGFSAMSSAAACHLPLWVHRQTQSIKIWHVPLYLSQ